MTFRPTLHRSSWLRLVLGLCLLLGLCIAMGGLAAPRAHAQTTLTVSTCDETHLDAAISQANSDNAGDVITFSCSGDIPLTSTLTISGSMTLSGSGQTVTLDGQNQVQVLFVNSGVTFTLNALTVAHGSANEGCGIDSIDSGGGLCNTGGTVTISTSTFANNSALGQFGIGGGLDNNSGTLTISNSTFASNSATVSGGLNNVGTLTISNSTFASNSATGGGGGGLGNNSGTVTISTSTFANNSATLSGGGLFNLGGMLTISTSTFANNSASTGGLYNSGGTLAIGGSIVANNPGGNCVNFLGILTDQGYNLSSDSSCGLTGTGDRQNTNPQLSALTNNGGPTQTMALQQGSPAIDAGPPAAQCPTTDQRGDARPDNGETTCDIGAYEFVDPVDNDLALTHVPTNITVDATSPQGAVVTYTPPTVVDEDSPLPSVSCSHASGSTFAIGATTVTCTASDSDDTNSPVSKAFTVTVKSAAAQVSDLINLVNSFGLPADFQASFDTQLQAVQTDLTNHNSTQACSDLMAFLNHVKAQSGKGLTTAQANQLTAAAQQVQAVLGC